ncbi:UPF0757 protein YmgG-like [Anabrus simplex]|uniref:UPF0757 protein YmgG-like n=1 Tax=Anabrus simplex TaxID=316456 RepID=UPI0035A2C2C9
MDQSLLFVLAALAVFCTALPVKNVENELPDTNSVEDSLRTGRNSTTAAEGRSGRGLAEAAASGSGAAVGGVLGGVAGVVGGIVAGEPGQRFASSAVGGVAGGTMGVLAGGAGGVIDGLVEGNLPAIFFGGVRGAVHGGVQGAETGQRVAVNASGARFHGHCPGPRCG